MASSSPRRKELLTNLGLKFVTHPSDVNESISTDMPPENIVQSLSLRKATAVASNYKSGIVIGSDTIVVFENEVLGKPKDKNDAFEMLSKLQGKTHFVYTGLSLLDAATKQSRSSYSKTEVRFKQMDEDLINRYIDTGEAYDKAGAYGIQSYGATLVEKINGDYFTVVGLPLNLLSEMLAEFDVKIF